MTVKQVINETRDWTPGQITELIRALNAKQPARGTNGEDAKTPRSSLKDYRRKLDELWKESKTSYTDEQIVTLIRESRG